MHDRAPPSDIVLLPRPPCLPSRPACPRGPRGATRTKSALPSRGSWCRLGERDFWLVLESLYGLSTCGGEAAIRQPADGSVDAFQGMGRFLCRRSRCVWSDCNISVLVLIQMRRPCFVWQSPSSSSTSPIFLRANPSLTSSPSSRV